jgi:hypothetical protein
MSKRLKQELKSTGCQDHVNEFGDKIGVVRGPVNYGTQLGPEVDVIWPGNLRYAYKPEDLDVV